MNEGIERPCAPGGYDQCVRILAVSGSLRRASSNTALLQAAVRLAPAGVEVLLYRELAALPPFNPDDNDSASPAVGRLRAMLLACDALLISSPEYAHGVPGVLKNALDWIVGSGELTDKPVALINASPRASRAWASLVETLTVMSARVVSDASVMIPVRSQDVDADALAADPSIATPLRSALSVLVRAALEARLAALPVPD